MTIAQTGGAHGDTIPTSEMLNALDAVPPLPANEAFVNSMAAMLPMTGYRMPAERVQPLAGHLDFITDQKAIQHCLMARRRHKQAISPLAALHALYAALQ